MKKEKTDPVYRLMKNYKRRILYFLGSMKGIREYIGCSWEMLMQHLEKQFEKNQGDRIMTRENYGEWEIDHIIPFCSTNEKEKLIKLMHYTNCQPLWGEDNLKKKKEDIKLSPKKISPTDVFI